MHRRFFSGGLVAWCCATAVVAQNPDFRIEGSFRVPNGAAWAAGESVGNVDFRIRSRFGQVYYGGVIRSDEFRVSVGLQFADISGFAEQFASSPYNTDYDAYIENQFIGRAYMNTDGPGNVDLSYDSRHPDFPTLPLPANFPDPVDAGNTVRLFAAAAALPSIGDPLPSGTPLFATTLEERYARGDVNQDGHVDDEDFAFLASHYDPFHVSGPYVGPALGDFTGNNTADSGDYALFVQNWDRSEDPPAEPAPTQFHAGDVNRDGHVDLADLARLLAAFGAQAGGPAFDAPADVDNDGSIGLSDLSILLAHFGL